MAHKARQVLQAIETAVTGLPTTGDRVEKTRGYPKADVPAISIRISDLDPQSEISNAFLDSFLEVDTIYHVRGANNDLDYQILEIDAEVYRAIMADRTLAGDAIDVDPLSLSVESEAANEIPTATGIRRWRVHIRHDVNDAEL